MGRRGKFRDDQLVWLSIPVAPSLNRKFISRRFVVSQEWRKFKEAVADICLEQKVTPIDGDLFMSIKWYRKAKRGDADSKLKAVLDSLEGFAYENDRQVKTLKITRSDEEKENPRMIVHIRPWRNDG